MARKPSPGGIQQCPMCGGVGAIQVPKKNPESGVRYTVTERCKACAGTGLKK
jgi:DnaJ-class molecular chaperone